MEETSRKTSWFVIVNPNAGNGKGRKDWRRISGLLDKNLDITEAKFTEKKGDAITYACNAVGAGSRNILSVGGDGTLNEIVNGIFTQAVCRTEDITLGLLPVGTGNDWGRMFGIPTIYEGAVQVLTEAKVMMHDIGFAWYHTENKREKRYFINIAGLGFESLVVRKTNRQKDKGKSNKAIYFYNLLSSLISFRNIQCDILIDGRKESAKVFSINIGNGRYCGGGMRQTPEAVPDDGLLDITVIKEMGRLEIIKSLKLLYDGTILSHPKVDGYRSNNLAVYSDQLLLVEADGESLGHTPAEFGIIPSAVKVVYGTKLIP